MQVKLDKYFEYIQSKKDTFGVSSIWMNLKDEFNYKSNFKQRDSYVINKTISNRTIIFQLKIINIIHRFYKYTEKYLFNNIIRKSSFLYFKNPNFVNELGLFIKGNMFFDQKFIQSEHFEEIDNLHKKLGWKYSYMSVKACYNFCEFNKYFEKLNDVQNILEIGSGMCQFACILTTLKDKYFYICVDLPEMIPLGYKNLLENVRECDVFLPNEIEECMSSNSSKKILFITPDLLNNIEFNPDLFINIESFGEMPQKVANNYLEDVSEKMSKDGIILLINRISRLVESSNENDLKSWFFFSDLPLSGFKYITKKIDGFKNLKSFEKERANIFYLGKKFN